MQQFTKVTLIQSAAIQNRFFLFTKLPLTLKYFWAADDFKLTHSVYIKTTGSYFQITVIYDSYVIDCNCNLLPPLLSRRQPPVSKLPTGRFWGFCLARVMGCTDEVEIWHGGHTEFHFHWWRDRDIDHWKTVILLNCGIYLTYTSISLEWFLWNFRAWLLGNIHGLWEYLCELNADAGHVDIRYPAKFCNDVDTAYDLCITFFC